MAGKTITYLIICMIQFYMMVASAVFLFPGLGLPALNVEGNMLLMSIVAAFSGFAAIGFGILLGTVAKTQEQSAPFEPHRRLFWLRSAAFGFRFLPCPN
jgi:ABC-2 type transport system permease protein